jgi:hypothetical protein
MRPYRCVIVACICILPAVEAATQELAPFPKTFDAGSEPMGILVCALPPRAEGLPKNQDDPAYATYKEGYTLILSERWTEARKKLAEVMAKYPKSEYIDDAQYWSAYALMHIDKTKAIEAYREFMRKSPKSSYYDDAIADLGDLEGNVLFEGNVLIRPQKPPDAYLQPPAMPNMYISREPDRTLSVTIAPNVRSLERRMRRAVRRYGRLDGGGIAPFPVLRYQTDEKLDDNARLKMQALYALGETKEDEKSYQTLKEVALSQKQPLALRQAAMEALASLRRYDAIPILVEIARDDTSQDLRDDAVDFIGERFTDKNKTVTVLIDLFNSIPKSRTGQRETIFYTIADIGNDRAVDFLCKVALTHENYALRQDAVHYLGSIGGEKAREALYEILKAK